MIIKPSECVAAFSKLNKPQEIKKKCLTTGFDFLDSTIKLAKGYSMVVSGYPGSGKSEFVDAILTNCAILHNWNILYFSPENYPIEEHMGKIAERYMGLNIRQFKQETIDTSLFFLEKHFTWMFPENPTLEVILGLAQQEHRARSIDALVIDPWNNVTHNRGDTMVHEYLSESLSRVIRFGRVNNILIIIVAHPKNPAPQKDGTIPHPNLWDISEGAMWRNKMDYGIICHRPDMSEHTMEAYFQKIKYKWMGMIGMHTFDYEYATGRYKGQEQKEFKLPHEIEPPF